MNRRNEMQFGSCVEGRNSMSIRWPKVLTPAYLSHIIRSQKNPLTALQLFNEAEQKYPDYRHNGPVYSTMVGILGESGRISEMKDVIDQMKQDSCECKDSVFVGAIKILAGAGLTSEAVSLFNSIPQFNCVNWTESFNTTLEILMKHSDIVGARRVFLENSYGWGVKSRVRALNLLMGALCGTKRSDLALNIFQEMDYQGCCPDRESYRILMKGLCQDGRLNEAVHLLYSMFWRISQKGSGPDVVIYRTLLDALCDNGKVEEGVEILGKILRKGLKAPKSRHRFDLSKCEGGEDVEAAKRLINEALIQGGVPSMASYNAMAVDLYDEGRIDEAEKVLDEMRLRALGPSLPIYEAKVTALCKQGRVEEALKVIDGDMKLGTLIPTVRLYNVVLKGLCNEGNSLIAAGYLKKMAKQVGCVPDKETYSILVDGLLGDGRFLESSRVLEQMLIRSYRPPTHIYNKLITGLCSIGRQYEAFIWLEEMIGQGNLPEHSTWTFLVLCVCGQRNELRLPL